MKKEFTIIIGFIHDFAAGCWAATVLGIYWLSIQSLPADIGVVITGLKKQFFWAGVVCVITVFATGAGRTFTYVENVYGPDAEKRRRKLLIIKHLILLSIFGLGTWWQYAMTF
jgi:hypothetical protein